MFQKTKTNIERFDKTEQVFFIELLRFLKGKYEQTSHSTTKNILNILHIALTSALKKKSYENRYAGNSEQSGNRQENYSKHSSYGTKSGNSSKQSYGNHYGGDEKRKSGGFKNSNELSYLLVG